MAQKISRNDYYKMIRETGRIPKDDEYEILPLDLSAYSLNEETKALADKLFSTETTNRNGEYMLDGHWLSDISFSFANHCGFDLHPVNSYVSFAISDEQMAIFTYTEGDISLTLFTDRAKYKKEKADTFNFYKEVYDYE